MSGVFGPTLALSIMFGMVGIPPGVPGPDASGQAPAVTPSQGSEPSPSASGDTPGISAASAATAAKLKEIGHVHATTEFCKLAVDRTTQSILILLENDRRIGDVQNSLKAGDFDTSEISRGNAVRQLTAEFVALRSAAKTGNGQMALLKTQLKDSPTPEQRDALLALQEALDGALLRQKRLADRINVMIVFLENKNRIDATQEQQNEFASMYQQNVVGAYHDPEGPLMHLPSTLSEIAKADAVDIHDKTDAIDRDEATVSDRLDPAFAGCL